MFLVKRFVYTMLPHLQSDVVAQNSCNCVILVFTTGGCELKVVHNMVDRSPEDVSAIHVICKIVLCAAKYLIQATVGVYKATSFCRG